MKPIVVAMDGPSGSGKSSTSRGVAARLGLAYLDTGAQFRAMTLWMLRNGVDLSDPDAIARRAGEPVLTSGTSPGSPTIRLGAEDVSAEIRSEDVTAAVSAVAAVPAVRARLLDLQRDLIAAALLERGIVAEGRDIGSVVWPTAEVKVYLTADPAARARRRAAEEGHDDVANAQQSLQRRDQLDSSRQTAPLVVPDGCHHIDSTNDTLDEVIDRITALVHETVGGHG